MTIYSKKTLVQWKDNIDDMSTNCPEFDQKKKKFILGAVDNNLTDGNLEIDRDRNIIKQQWVDERAAQDWIEFLETNVGQHITWTKILNNDYYSIFWINFNPNVNQLDDEKILDFDQQADNIVVAFFTHEYDHHSQIIQHLLPKCNRLHVFLGEPTFNEKQQNLYTFLLDHDIEKITFYSDCILNFSLKNASHHTQIFWFMDPINYYTESRWGKKLLTQLETRYDKPYKFDALLGQEKIHRDYVFNKCKFDKNFIVTYFKTHDNLASGIWPDWANPSKKPNQLNADHCDIDGEMGRFSAVIPVDIYNQSYYSIICETTFFNEYSFYTEKTAKPILALRPFVAFNGQHWLKNFRSLGFMTFGEVIDESYDDIADYKQRWDAAWQQVELLCTLDPKMVLTKLDAVLKHNRQHFLSIDWIKPARKLSYQF